MMFPVIRLRAICASLIVLCGHSVVLADESAYTMPRSRQWTMKSRGGHEYRIFAAIPEESAPAAGYPVIYVLDGNAYFATMVESHRVQAMRPAVTRIGPAIIVGIGYPGDASIDHARRTYDMTTPESASARSPGSKGAPGLRAGGAQQFLAWIRDELKPVIERRWRIDRGRQALFGHSLGGWFVLHALLEDAYAFQAYISVSPAVWWNDKEILRRLDRLAHIDGRPGDAATRVLIVAGEDELAFMNQNARDFAVRLSELRYATINVKFLELADEHHLSVGSAVIPRALRYALVADDR